MLQNYDIQISAKYFNGLDVNAIKIVSNQAILSYNPEEPHKKTLKYCKIQGGSVDFGFIIVEKSYCDTLHLCCKCYCFVILIPCRDRDDMGFEY